MRRFVCILLACLLIGLNVYAVPVTVSPKAQAYQLFLLGILVEADGDIHTALKLYQKVLKLDPDVSPEVYYRLANIYSLLGRMKDTEETLKDMLQKFPDELDAYLWLIRVLLQEGKIGEVDTYYEALLKKTIEISPENGGKLYQYLGEYYLRKGRYKKAIEYLKRAVSFSTVSPEPYFLLGALYYKQGEIDASISYLKRALQKDPDYDLALNFLGYLYVEIGQNFDEAEKLLKRAVELKPEEPAYLDSLGWLYVKKGELDKAEAYLKKAGLKEDPEIYYHLGILYMKKGDVERANSYLGLALAWAEKGSDLRKKILKAIGQIKEGKEKETKKKNERKGKKVGYKNVPSH